MGVPNNSVDKESVAAIAEYTNHVNLYFFSGAELSSNLLQGTGKKCAKLRFRVLLKSMKKNSQSY